jgi:hypothetical protein
MFKVKELEKAPKWDGHTPTVALERISTICAEVKHGEWKWGKGLGGQYGIWCTNCGSGWVDSVNAEWIAREHDYCGKCGAKMDGGKAE